MGLEGRESGDESYGVWRQILNGGGRCNEMVAGEVRSTVNYWFGLYQFVTRHCN